MKPDRHAEHKQHAFDSFCKKVLREEARDYMRYVNRLSEREVNLSELSEEQLSQLCALDEYPSEQTSFDVQGYSVAIKDARLAEALASLSEEKRDIVLLSYFLDMNDGEIADRLNIMRRTVQRRRTSSLTEIRNRMEVLEDGKESD